MAEITDFKKTERRKEMTKEGQKYQCKICGNEVVVTKAGAGTLVCCGKPMEAMD